ncbi:hypothetical protein ON010_g2052 [Phytophthora cinnamomi]|nr:hypothetical protein ON010_g2052 [Phytophthora cinnamomi]
MGFASPTPSYTQYPERGQVLQFWEYSQLVTQLSQPWGSFMQENNFVLIWVSGDYVHVDCGSSADGRSNSAHESRARRYFGELRSLVPILERVLIDGRACHQQLSACLDRAYTVLRECHAASTRTELLGVMAPTLSGGGSTTAIQQPQKTAGTCTVSAATMDKPHESAQGADSPNNKANDHGSAQGADTAKNHAEAEPLAKSELNDFSSDAISFITKRQAVIRFVQDTIAASVDQQKLNADNVGRSNTNEFKFRTSEQASLLRASSGRSLCWHGTATHTR